MIFVFAPSELWEFDQNHQVLKGIGLQKILQKVAKILVLDLGAENKLLWFNKFANLKAVVNW